MSSRHRGGASPAGDRLRRRVARVQRQSLGHGHRGDGEPASAGTGCRHQAARSGRPAPGLRAAPVRGLRRSRWATAGGGMAGGASCGHGADAGGVSRAAYHLHTFSATARVWSSLRAAGVGEHLEEHGFADGQMRAVALLIMRMSLQSGQRPSVYSAYPLRILRPSSGVRASAAFPAAIATTRPSMSGNPPRRGRE